MEGAKVHFNHRVKKGFGRQHTTFTSCQNAACSNNFFLFLWRVDYALEGNALDCKTVRFCVFEYARAVKQKVWNEAENRERDWGETLKVFFLSPHTPYERVRLARFARLRLLREALPFSLLILRKKPTVLQSRLFTHRRTIVMSRATCDPIHAFASICLENQRIMLVHAFITSRVDYCISHLYGLPNYQLHKLQRVLNASARLVCNVPRFCHILPILRGLHWIPVKARIQNRYCLLRSKQLTALLLKIYASY